MNITPALGRELRRLLAANKYEASDSGLFFPSANLSVQGMGTFRTQVIRNGVAGPWQIDNNTMTTEGLTHLLNVGFHDASKTSTWYVSLYSNNYTPVAGLTAATYPATAGEEENYDESTRVAYVENAASSASINNTGSEAQFTISTGGATVWGSGLHSASAKSATTGVLACAVQFSAVRNLLAADLLKIGYTITLTPA